MHIVTHGCIQDAETEDVGDLFCTKSGYDESGEDNNIIMLYRQTIGADSSIMMRTPQAMGTATPNQYGCMDWGEYNYQDPGFHSQEGVQLKAIVNMVKRLAGEEFEPPEITNICRTDGNCCRYELFGFCFYLSPYCCN